MSPKLAANIKLMFVNRKSLKITITQAAMKNVWLWLSHYPKIWQINSNKIVQRFQTTNAWDKNWMMPFLKLNQIVLGIALLMNLHLNQHSLWKLMKVINVKGNGLCFSGEMVNIPILGINKFWKYLSI